MLLPKFDRSDFDSFKLIKKDVVVFFNMYNRNKIVAEYNGEYFTCMDTWIKFVCHDHIDHIVEAINELN